MARDNATFTIDDREWQAYYRKFTPKEIDKLLTKASRAGATAAAKVVKARAPIGTSDRPSQYYRKTRAGHGSFRATVRAKQMRKRGLNAQTVGHVIAPMGKFAFTRAWLEAGTRPHGGHPGTAGKHWFRSAADAGSGVANTATARILETYARDR
jgi:hypothetical protein